MIVRDLYVSWLAVVPSETDSPLVVDPDTVLPLPVPAELSRSVRRWNAKVIQIFRTMENNKLPIPDQLDVPRMALRKPLLPDFGRLLVLERLDHIE